MPSSHAPIKKYNYERSLFRWVMSRHPEPFEKHGITTRTLERAPLARQAFYTSDWPGARALVQSSDESKQVGMGESFGEQTETSGGAREATCSIILPVSHEVTGMITAGVMSPSQLDETDPPTMRTKVLNTISLDVPAGVTQEEGHTGFLIHRPSAYERTAFFDAIIERGLRDGTKFNIDHVTTDEKTTLGIAFDRATEKFFLAAYGTPKAGRSTGRRGSLTSQTSSDGDGSDQQLQNKERSHRHPVVKELSDFLLAEIEAAGKDAEVKTLKHRVMPEPSSGCKIIQFSVSIRRRAPRGFGQAPQAEGAGAGPTTVAVSTAQAADAGGGKPSAPSPSRSPQRGKRGSPKVSTTPSLSLGPGAPLASGNGVSPKRFPQSNSPSRSRGLQELKSRCRPLSAVNCEGDEGWDGVGGEDISKRRKRVAHPVFANAPKVDAMAVPKQEAQPAGSDASHRPDMRLGRMTLMDGGIRPQAPTPNLGAVRPSYLPPGVASMIPPLQRGANSAAVQHSGTSSSSRSYLPGPISSAWNSKSWIPNAGVGTGSRTIPTQTSREITAGAPDPSAPSAAPPSSTSTSWGFNAAPSRRNADFVAHSSSSRVMGSAESRAAVVTTTMATATTPGLTSFMSLPPLPPLSQPGCQYQRPQHHGEGMPFGARGVTTQTQDQLLPYLEQGRQQRQAALDDKSSSSYECWDTAPVPREIGAPGPGKDTEDDNLDFLGVFF